MSDTRKLAAILVADVVGYSRLAGADEDRTLARLRALRSDLIDPTIALHHGRVVKRTGDGAIIEFRSVVDAIRCAVEVQAGMAERNSGVGADRRIEFRVGIHLGDVVEEDDGDLMGDGVNIAARLEGVAKPGAICLSEDAYRQVKQRIELKFRDLGIVQLKNIAEPVRIYSLELGNRAPADRARLPRPVLKRRPLILAGAAIALALIAAATLRSIDFYYLERGNAAFASKHPREAIQSYRRVGTLTLEAQVLLIVSYVEVGMDGEARAEARALLKRSPRFSVDDFLQQTRVNAAIGDSLRLKRALIAAGLPAEVGWECLTRNNCQ